MSEKMMTEREIWDRSNKEPGPIRDLVDEVFLLARRGTIPAEGAISVPDVGEWPEWADEIRVVYAHNSGRVVYRVPIIKIIPRPIPAWTPKVGEVVFFRDPNMVHVAVIHGIDRGIRYEVQKADGQFDGGTITTIKPFDPAKIGKPWSEI